MPGATSPQAPLFVRALVRTELPHRGGRTPLAYSCRALYTPNEEVDQTDPPLSSGTREPLTPRSLAVEPTTRPPA